MKLRKVLALMSALVLSVSVFASTAIVADAAVPGVTATLEFTGYETIGATTFAHIAVKATIPDELAPYTMTPADWVNTFEDSFTGTMIQSVGFDIPNVTGLQYIASKSSCAEYVQIQNNTTAGKVTVYAANTGAYDTYYAGTVDVLANLCYRITGAVDATYEMALTDAVIGLVDVTGEGTAVVTPKKYMFGDFAVTNATIKPAAPSVTATTVGGWDTGDGLLVIGKVTGEATVKGITIAGYTIPTGKDAGKGPNFVVTAPASAQGYYGAFIEGIAAGTYSVNAYADDVTGVATSAVKN
jgi:hypothetical protein